jgi:hypothetical protein
MKDIVKRNLICAAHVRELTDNFYVHLSVYVSETCFMTDYNK